MLKIKNIYETLFVLKTAVALVEYVMNSEKTDHLEIDNVIQVPIDGKEYTVQISRLK